jgi:hypothetical protein
LLGKRLLSSVVLFVLLSFGFVGSVEADATMWSQTYGGPTYYSTRAMVATSDGCYAIAGETRSLGSTGADFWLVKTDETGFVPEHPSFILSSLLMTATLVIVIYRKRLLNRP